jgi:hypothetical protein
MAYMKEDGTPTMAEMECSSSFFVDYVSREV